MVLSCLEYCSTLQVGVTCSSETSVAFHGTTRGHITEDATLHNHRRDNLRLDTVVTLFCIPSLLFCSTEQRVALNELTPGYKKHVERSTRNEQQVRSSETSANVYQNTRRCIPHVSIPHRHCCHNLKPNIGIPYRGGTRGYSGHLCLIQTHCLAHSSTLKIEAISPFETSVDF